MVEHNDELQELRIGAFPAQLAAIAAAHGAAQATARSLTAAEIAELEQNNNRCEDWSSVLVGERFRTDRVFDSIFIGPCVLAGWSEDTPSRPAPGQEPAHRPSLAPGVYSSTVIASSLLEDCCLHRAPRVENAYIGRGALLESCSIVSDPFGSRSAAADAPTAGTGAAGTRAAGGDAGRDTAGDADHDLDDLFSNVLELPLGLEDGLRSVPVVVDASMQLCARLCADPAWLSGKQVGRAFSEYRDAIRTALRSFPRYKASRRPAVVCEYAGVRNTTVGDGAFIGPHAVIHGAAAVQRTTVLSNAGVPTRVTNAAVLEGALVQEGCLVSNGARVLEALMLEHSSVSDGATLEHSVLGPNSKLAHGEAHAALIGPFVSFHHQSLLISARWPEGRGNIGYGANVGSNHTSRRADQEIRIGEGMFFGLSSAVKFPAEFTDAPYSIIATAVTTLPQTLAYPFSLLIEHETSAAGAPSAPTRVLPGWVLYRNAYMLMRSSIKFARRDRSSRHRFVHSPFNPTVLAAVRRARAFLAAAEPGGACYGPGELHGIGKNVLYEADRVAAIEAYDCLLRREELRARVEAAAATDDAEATPGTATAAGTGHGDEASPQAGLTEGELDEYVMLVERFADEVLDSIRRDYERGTRTIPDYAESHPVPDDDEVVRAARELVEDARRAVAMLRGISAQ